MTVRNSGLGQNESAESNDPLHSELYCLRGVQSTRLRCFVLRRSCNALMGLSLVWCQLGRALGGFWSFVSIMDIDMDVDIQQSRHSQEQ